MIVTLMTTFDSCVIDNGDDYFADVIVITATMIHIPIISKFRVLRVQYHLKPQR